MKTTIIKIATVAVSLLTFAQNGFCQGFVNLNFESAQIIPIAGGPYVNSIATSNALPGWTVLYGSSQQSVMSYNAPALGSTFVTLYATNGLQLAGNYSVLLQGGGTASAATISQTGLVPADALSLLFYGAANSSLSSGLVVSLGGQDISFSAISNELNYTLYGGNIPSDMAGLSEPLTFSALEAFGGYNNWNIDDIQFSSSAVPEPSTLALCALGGLFLVWRNRRICSKA
jgi:hypothetical protein